VHALDKKQACYILAGIMKILDLANPDLGGRTILKLMIKK